MGLGISLWPGPPLVGMLIYSTAVALYLLCVGVSDGLTGILLWPIVDMSVLLGRIYLVVRQLMATRSQKSMSAVGTKWTFCFIDSMSAFGETFPAAESDA